MSQKMYMQILRKCYKYKETQMINNINILDLSDRTNKINLYTKLVNYLEKKPLYFQISMYPDKINPILGHRQIVEKNLKSKNYTCYTLYL